MALLLTLDDPWLLHPDPKAPSPPRAPVKDPDKGPPMRDPGPRKPPEGDPPSREPPRNDPRPRPEPGAPPVEIDDPAAPGAPPSDPGIRAS